ncbi:MAG: hypothetical protein WD361_01225 [Gracilimonas sp.]
MKIINLLIILLMVLIPGINAQGIESYSFDNEEGVYIVHYKWSQEDTLRKAVYVPANQVSPEINATIIFDQTDNIFKYNFLIRNENTAKHPLFSIDLEVYTSINNISSPSPDWWGRKLDNKKLVRWIKRRGLSPGIEIGESGEGFGFKSKGLPRTSTVYFSSLTHIFHPENDEPPYFVVALIDSIRKESNAIDRITLAPWYPDSTMSLQDFTDTLQTFRYQACEELGWVTNHGVCNSLEVKIRNVKRHIERGQLKQAGNVLRAFLNEVDAQRGKHITEEGYALLNFNARYLRDQINEPAED